MIIKIPVKQEHINKGTISDPSSCALALAVQDHENKDAWFGLTLETYDENTNETQEYFPTTSTIEFINKFDTDPKTVKPGTLHIDTITERVSFHEQKGTT